MEIPATPGSFTCAYGQAFVLYTPAPGNVWTAWTREDSTLAQCSVDWSQNGNRAVGSLHAVVVPDPAIEQPAGTPASRTIDVTFDVGPDSHVVK